MDARSEPTEPAPAAETGAEGAPPQRRFGAPAGASMPPAAPPAGVRVKAAAPRDLWMRVTLFVMLLGAVLTVLYAWFVFHPPVFSGARAADMASFQRVGVPLLALAAVVGVLVLERAAVPGVVLMLVSTGLGWAGGAVWLLPGTVLGCIWAARHHDGARTAVGLLLLVPGAAAGYYGLVGVIGYASGSSMRGLLPSLAPAATWQQALAPLELLPLALLGAWLLVCPLREPGR